MTKKIFGSIIAVAASILVSCLVIIMGVLFRYFENMEKQQLAVQCDLVAQGIQKCGQAEYFEDLELQNYRITWIASDGRVLYDNYAAVENMDNHANRKEIKEALEYGEGEDERYSDTMMKKTVYHAKRLPDGSVIRMSVLQNSIWGLIFGMTQPFAIIIFVAVILSFIIANYISKRIVRPLNALNLDRPLDNDTYEELAPLLRRIEHQHRKIQEQMSELSKQKDEFAAITEGMSEGLVLLGREDVILSMNSAAIRLLEADAQCIGKSILTVYRNTELQEAIETAWKKGSSSILMSLTGREYQWNISSVQNDGQIIGLCLFAFDITEKIQAERMRREFTANVSHELKTPLHSIMGTAELMENGLMKSEDEPYFAGRIRKEASRLVELIDDIIRLSQLDEKADFKWENVDITELITDVWDTLSEAADAKGITMQIVGESQTVYGVRRLLHEIIYNLLDNAIKYSKEPGSVDILLRADEITKRVSLTVSDHGIGIPKEHQARIFERFYRVDKSHSRMTGGTGLGLSIVKHAAEYHHANIELKSRIGFGTVITVKDLPAAHTSSAEDPESDNPENI